MTDPRITRRSLLAAGGVASAAVAGAPLLAACSKKHSSAEQNDLNEKVHLPSYLPYNKVRPDLPGSSDGALPAFLHYPANPVRATSGKPGSGGSMTALVPITSGLPPAVGKNQYWQGLNDRLGTDLKLQMAPDGPDYTNKLATLFAGGSLPDAMCVESPPSQPNMADVATHEFQDLTDYVGGDAVKEYPFLANLPTNSWKVTVFNGGIYGVPIPRASFGTIVFLRKDFIGKKSLSMKPKNFAEFRELCKGLTDKRSSRWAVDRPAAALQIVACMLGKPNAWAAEGGVFTSRYTTDEIRQSLSAVRTLVTDGVCHPDGFAATAQQAKEWFRSGVVSVFSGGYKGWMLDVFAGWPDQAQAVGGLVEPGFDGGKGTHVDGAPAYSMTAFKKAGKTRIKELLRICNYLSAPIGTEEYLFRKYGVDGVDSKKKGPDPELTRTGTNDLLLPAYYVGDSPDVIYAPGQADNVRVIHDYLAEEAPLIVPNPTFGLYSDTNSTKGTTLGSTLDDLTIEIVQGRKSLKDWDDAVGRWRKSGGDTIRKEYEAAYKKAHS